MEKLKKYLPDVLAVVLFAVIAFAYFMPADLEGRILYQHDTSAGRGAGQEALEYLQKTGERTRWTNSTFSGMPTYQTSPSYKSTDLLSKVMDAYHLWLPENVWFVFAYLLGFYILMRAFDFRRELAVLGSIVWAFSSYFFIIIAAGHIWKVWALAYLPPMIAGIVLAYRGKYLWGFILTALFAAFEVKANHVQMTYYYLFPIAMMVVAFIVQSLTSRYAEATGWKHVVKATAVCLAAGAIGILINISNLYHTWEYSKETMRGKSELVKPNTGNQTSSGLERDYITQWSYGIGETWTLLIPNTKGGASVPLARNEKAMQKADPNYLPLYQQIGQYWGEQPMTSGPVYVGAFVLMLFVLGLLVVKGPMKWALLAATILSIMLSWGKNFMGLTDFFIDHVPMYAKFRTVASILVIAEFTIPLLAMMALGKVLGNGWWGKSPAGVQGSNGSMSLRDGSKGLSGSNGSIGYPYALNDIAVLKRDNASMITIHARINGDELVTYQADGLVVSTPTGSTAYNLSNGGPIMAPLTGILCLTPVAPHSLNIRPIVINDDSVIELTVESRTHNYLVAVDGRSAALDERIPLVISKAPYTVRIVKRASQHYFATLREKMMWGMDAR